MKFYIVRKRSVVVSSFVVEAASAQEAENLVKVRSVPDDRFFCVYGEDYEEYRDADSKPGIEVETECFDSEDEAIGWVQDNCERFLD